MLLCEAGAEGEPLPEAEREGFNGETLATPLLLPVLLAQGESVLPAVGETRDVRLGVGEGVPDARGETEGERLPETQPLLERDGEDEREPEAVIEGEGETSGERLELSAPLLVRLARGEEVVHSETSALREAEGQ